MLYRKANLQDIDSLVNIRKQQLVDEGIAPSIDIDDELTAYFNSVLNDGTLVEWIVEDENNIIATAAVAFYQFPPTYTNKTGKKGHITNMYTKDEYRGRGIATALLHKLVEEAKAKGLSKLWLGASKMGRPVYEKFGFRETGGWLEMDL